MISVLKITLFSECILIILETLVMANDQMSNAELYPVVNSEHGDDHFYFIPLDKKYDYFYEMPSKSVPSITPIVRRNDFFYAKNLKTLPRIGRRNDFFLKAANAKSVPRIGRRDEFTAGNRELTSSWPWYRSDPYMPRVMKKSLELGKTHNEASVNKEISETPFQAETQ